LTPSSIGFVNVPLPETHSPRLRIAVIGGGVAGVAASWLLQRRHHVVLFEKGTYLGGHTNTVEIPDGPDAGVGVDTGFIVLNDRNYPMFEEFLRLIGVPSRISDMSFSFHCEQTGLHYAGTGLNGLFAQRGNALNPPFLRMLTDIFRFNRRAKKDLDRGVLAGMTLGQYLGALKTGRSFADWYLIPMGAAIWSTPPGQMLEFPAETFMRFFDNHGLLTVTDQPTWKTVVGGSQQYMKTFRKLFTGEIHLNAGIRSIRRADGGVQIRFQDGSQQSFDRVVVATHADTALKLLEDPSLEESRLLGPWRYEKNRTVLHTDISVLPPSRRAWASWNYTREKSARESEPPLSMTYYMNQLQGLQTHHHYCVSLNRSTPIREKNIVAEFDYTHPIFDGESMATQPDLPTLNGVRGTYFCGSYFGFGFHEDAFRSGVQVGEAFGLGLAA
jgi:predicted NAD/FAD-binding protein